MAGRTLVSLAASLAFAALVASPAGAVTVSGTYYEDTADVSCPNTDVSCALNFAVLPSSTTGQFLTLTGISCYMYLSQPWIGSVLRITDTGANERRPHFIEGNRLSGPVYPQRPLAVKISGGPPRQLKLLIVSSAPGTFYAQCTIVGTLSSQ